MYDKRFESVGPCAVFDENGSGPVYKGDVYRLETSETKRIAKKVLCVVFMTLYFGFCLLAGFRDVAANKGWAALPYIASLLFGCYCAMGAVNLLVSPRDMSKPVYEEYTKQIRYGTRLAMFASGVTALVHLAFLLQKLILVKGAGVGEECLSLLFCVAGCACVACIRRLERQSIYSVTPCKRSGGEEAENEK